MYDVDVLHCGLRMWISLSIKFDGKNNIFEPHRLLKRDKMLVANLHATVRISNVLSKTHPFWKFSKIVQQCKLRKLFKFLENTRDIFASWYCQVCLWWETYAIVCKLVSRLINKEFLSIYKTSRPQGAPLTYFTDGGSGDFFGSEIFAKRDFLGLWKTRVFFLGGGGSREKTQELFWVLYFSSAQINNNISVIYWYCGIWRGGVC